VNCNSTAEDEGQLDTVVGVISVLEGLELGCDGDDARHAASFDASVALGAFCAVALGIVTAKVSGVHLDHDNR
jgi:hypothetical protein